MHTNQDSAPQNGEVSRFYWNEEDTELVEQLVSGYEIDGKLSFSAAFAAHPEWKEQLLAGHSMSQLYAKASNARSKNKKEKKANRHAVVRVSDVAEAEAINVRPRGNKSIAALVADAQNLPQGQVNCCPNCGSPIHLWNRVAQVVFGA